MLEYSSPLLEPPRAATLVLYNNPHQNLWLTSISIISPQTHRTVRLSRKQATIQLRKAENQKVHDWSRNRIATPEKLTRSLYSQL